MENKKNKPFENSNNAFLFTRRALIFSTSISVFCFVWYFISLAIFFNANAEKAISIVTMFIVSLTLFFTVSATVITTYLNSKFIKWWKYSWFWILDLIVLLIYIIMIVISNNHGNNDFLKILYFDGYNYMIFSILLSVIGILNTLIIFYLYVSLKDNYGKQINH